MRIITDKVETSIDLDGNEVYFMDGHKAIEITDSELDDIICAYINSEEGIITITPYVEKLFSQYLRELLVLKSHLD